MDQLFLELSQFSQAKTAKEIKLEGEIQEYKNGNRPYPENPKGFWQKIFPGVAVFFKSVEDYEEYCRRSEICVRIRGVDIYFSSEQDKEKYFSSK